jgi:hypothetical protein
MKKIVLRDGAQFKSRDVIRIVVERTDSERGIGIPEMRKRLRILDALDSADGELTLEDADWELLKGLIARFPFAVAHREIVQVSDDVENA